MDGFVSFNLRKGAVTEEYVLYASIRFGGARMLLKLDQIRAFSKGACSSQCTQRNLPRHPDLELFDAVI